MNYVQKTLTEKFPESDYEIYREYQPRHEAIEFTLILRDKGTGNATHRADVKVQTDDFELTEESLLTALISNLEKWPNG